MTDETIDTSDSSELDDDFFERATLRLPKTLPIIGVPVGLTAANLGDLETAGQFYDYISRVGGDNQAYKLNPPNDRHVGAALDFYLILDSVGSIAPIASLLWQAYEKFIVPKRGLGSNETGIYLAIHLPNSAIVDIWLREQKTQAEFTNQFEHLVYDAFDHPDWQQTFEETLDGIRYSDLWVKVDDSPSDKA